MRFFNEELIKKVFTTSFPMIITELAYSILSITDTYFVSGLGKEALAGVGLGGYFYWLFSVVLVMFNGGLMVYVSQAYGAREFEKIRKGLGETIFYAGLTGLTLSVIGWFTGYQMLVIVSGSTGTATLLAYKYLRIRFIGLIIMSIAMCLDSSLIATGQTRRSMYANTAAVFLNIVLDPLMIYGLYGFPELGVEGAAYATVLSSIVSLFMDTYFIIASRLTPHPGISPQLIYRILKLGIPMALERIVFTLGNIVYIGVIARCGVTALAAHNIGIRIESLIYMPGFAFSLAAASLVGREVGRGDYVKAYSIGREAVKASLLLMTLLGIGIAVAAYYITAPFSPEDEDVHILASIYLVLAGLSEPGLALAMSCAGAIRGGGNTRLPVIVNSISFYASRIVPSLILVNYFGVIGAWIAMFIDVYVRGFSLYIIYSRRFYRLVRRVV